MLQRRVQSFLVRIVVGPDDASSPQNWHGRIRHIGSGHEDQFASVQDLVSFISEQINANPALINLITESLTEQLDGES